MSTNDHALFAGATSLDGIASAAPGHAGSYEEENWSRLSPHFREAHNRLRVLHGLPPIPPPAVDLYVAPKAPAIQKLDAADVQAARAAAMQFMRPAVMATPPGDEGFSINGHPARY